MQNFFKRLRFIFYQAFSVRVLSFLHNSFLTCDLVIIFFLLSLERKLAFVRGNTFSTKFAFILIATTCCHHDFQMSRFGMNTIFTMLEVLSLKITVIKVDLCGKKTRNSCEHIFNYKRKNSTVYF